MLPAAVISALLVAGAAPPTPADFVPYPTCLLYAQRGDLRIHVRAQDASAVCTSLARRSAFGPHWTLHARRVRRIVSPLCLVANPSAAVELEVVDDAAGGERGARICAGLLRAGWYDLRAPG